MVQDASQRKFDVLLFWALDRLSREGALETLQHLQRLTSYGVGWRSFTEQYLDSTGIFREAVISILATVAKQESIRLAEPTRAGLERVKRSGAKLGRPAAKVDASAIRALRGQAHLGVKSHDVQGWRGLRVKRLSVRSVQAWMRLSVENRPLDN